MPLAFAPTAAVLLSLRRLWLCGLGRRPLPSLDVLTSGRPLLLHLLLRPLPLYLRLRSLCLRLRLWTLDSLARLRGRPLLSLLSHHLLLRAMLFPFRCGLLRALRRSLMLGLSLRLLLLTHRDAFALRALPFRCPVIRGLRHGLWLLSLSLLLNRRALLFPLLTL